MKNTILSLLPTECPWRDTLYWFDTIDSTNNYAKKLAQDGAPEGTAILAGEQTGGRGRMGRSFHSPAGKGIYLSVILRPDCPPEQLMHLTCAAAVAMCDAVEQAAGIRPQIKWINDLILVKKKLGGILTELSLDPGSGKVRYAIIGVGLNCLHSASDLPQELVDIATSLLMATGKCPDMGHLAASMICSLADMNRTLLKQKQSIMDTYRQSCITLGKKVMVLKADERRPGTAVAIDNDGGLTVAYPDGTTEVVNSGEVSVRGMYGYSE